VTRFHTPDVIPEKAIRPVGTLHLTLGVMSLLTQERIESALAFLGSIHLRDLLAPKDGKVTSQLGLGGSESKSGSREEDLVLAPEDSGSGSGSGVAGGSRSDVSRFVTLRGLKSMHKPSETSILYSAPVDEDLSLQFFCTRLRDLFVDKGLLVVDTRPLLLHATIVNTTYVPGAKGAGRSKRRLMLDARNALESYEDFEWMADIRIEKVAVCRMGAKKMEDESEAYEVEGEVTMP
jgi:activating signal cointegrator complex subunit 1